MESVIDSPVNEGTECTSDMSYVTMGWLQLVGSLQF